MLKLENISIFYGAVQALRDVSLNVAEGEIVSIIGANGAGKSTLLKGITGLELPKTGRVLINDADVTFMKPHRRVALKVAMSPEGRGIFGDQTVADNLVLGAYSCGYARGELLDAMERQFSTFPRLKERRDQCAGTLSGGEQQMLAIARALISGPRILLLDEPSLGLAPLVSREIFSQLKALRSKGLTIVLVEQMANQALAISDRAYVLETGRVTMEGTGRDLLKNVDIRKAYLGMH
ncbi:ABC transporter ATP-binding protein [Bradyrhizobium sp.]|uniref:ABC transporter ATP-binding protein n=1 Tax=Bradyrhizobium sp. TaxID=376 RepID=UPI0039E40415